MKKTNRFIKPLSIIGSRLTLIALFILCLMPSQVLAARLAVFMSIDSTQSSAVLGSEFGPNSQMTLEIDNGNDGSVEYTETKSADSSGFVFFAADGNWSVQPGDFVRLFDDQPLPNIKEHIVDYLTLESIDYASDTLAGKSDPGKLVHVRVWHPSGSPWLNTVADGSGNWSVDFSGILDIVVGFNVLVETTDFDADNTRINWPVAGVYVAMSIDSTQSLGVSGRQFGPNSLVTLEIDNGNDGSVEYTETKSADSSGFVFFAADGNWSVQPGDFVRLFDDQPLPNIKEHIVDYLTLESIDYASDTLAGKSDPGNPIHVRVSGPSGSPFLNTVADGSGNWSVDFSGIIDIVVGFGALVETSDFDGDHTETHWEMLTAYVRIDIKPGSDPNCINKSSKGNVAVAILADSVDLTAIDANTIEIGDANPGTGSVGPARSSWKDVDGDGDIDLVLHFETPQLNDAGLLVDGNTLFITGELNDGTAIVGWDRIFLAGGPYCFD